MLFFRERFTLSIISDIPNLSVVAGPLKLAERKMTSGGSRQNVDRVLNQKNLTKNEIFVHFQSNLEILTGFQRPGLDPPATDDL